MTFQKKTLATFFALVFCVAAVQAGRYFTSPKGKLVFDKRATARAKGNPNAPIWIVEYVDFQCRTCRLGSAVLKDFVARHPGKVYLQVKFRPLVITHPYALKSAIYAECAANQGKFWPFYEALFDHQDEWKDSFETDDLFTAYARAAGINPKQLTACVADPETKKRVVAEKDEAMDLGVRSTPTFFINGNMVVGLEALKEELARYE